MEERNYCVYQHKNKTNGKVYIGITGQRPESRWLKGKGYVNCPYFGRAIELYGWDGFEHNILFNNLTKAEAEAKEIEMIEFYNSTDENCGYNILRGGDLGTSKYVYQYDRHTGQFIKKWDSTISVEQELGIPSGSVSLVCIGLNKTAHDFYFSYEDFGEYLPDEISIWINTNECLVPIAQYDLDGNYIASYPSLSEASRSVRGDNSPSKVQPTHKTSFGYIWKPMIDDSIDYTQNLNPKELPQNQPPANSKECYQYDLNGVFISSFINTIEAAKAVNGKQSPIATACRNHSKSYGFYWRYAKDVQSKDNLKKSDITHKHYRSKSVYQYDLDGNFINEFSTLTEAAQSCGASTSNISKTCSGEFMQTAGYIFRYEPTTFTKEEIENIHQHRSKKVKIA